MSVACHSFIQVLFTIVPVHGISRPNINFLQLECLVTHYHIIPHFDALKIYIAVENIVRKGEIACYKRFLLFSQCFLSYMVLISNIKFTSKCRLQFVSIWTSLIFCHLVMPPIFINTFVASVGQGQAAS